ncbi:hypothetical protein ACTHT5_11350, partial [Neisseria sp. P0022.S002]|uniref:hypothetical protein n=1 Tax=Neisseria sp. P0022.S002 TaxID=3436827 RepID=UPI003F7CE44E
MRVWAFGLWGVGCWGGVCFWVGCGLGWLFCFGVFVGVGGWVGWWVVLGCLVCVVLFGWVVLGGCWVGFCVVCWWCVCCWFGCVGVGLVGWGLGVVCLVFWLFLFGGFCFCCLLLVCFCCFGVVGLGWCVVVWWWGGGGPHFDKSSRNWHK